MDLSRRPTGRGGWRPGAGRPRGRKHVAHARRDELVGFKARLPLHVTWRLRDEVGSVRRYRTAALARRAIAAAHKAGFRVLEFSLQGNHLHCLVEAASAVDLARGMQGLAIRLARGWNRVLGRSGTVFAERYHARVLRSPREVRNVLSYILLNARKHAAERGERLSARLVRHVLVGSVVRGLVGAAPARRTVDGPRAGPTVSGGRAHHLAGQHRLAPLGAARRQRRPGGGDKAPRSQGRLSQRSRSWPGVAATHPVGRLSAGRRG